MGAICSKPTPTAEDTQDQKEKQQRPSITDKSKGRSIENSMTIDETNQTPQKKQNSSKGSRKGSVKEEQSSSKKEKLLDCQVLLTNSAKKIPEPNRTSNDMLFTFNPDQEKTFEEEYNGNLINNLLQESGKEENLTIVVENEEHYKKRIRDLYAITKDMQKNQRVALDEFKFYTKQFQVPTKDSSLFTTQSFYMNGSLKQLENEGQNVYVHSTLVDAGYTNLQSCLQKQTVIDETSDDIQSIQTEDDILRFLQLYSTSLKSAKEVTFLRETLNATLYTVLTVNALQNSLVVKVPKKHSLFISAFDLINSVQLFSVLKRLEPNSHFAPELVEEILMIDQSSRQILNYVAIVSHPQTSLFQMLTQGPITGANQTTKLTMLEDVEDETYTSQEVLTQSKLLFLFLQGLLMLQSLYNQGIYHGSINALNLRITDQYTLSLSDFEVCMIDRGFKSLSETQKQTKLCTMNGMRVNTASELIQENNDGQVYFKDLIQEDWRNFVASFYFAKRRQVVTDERIKTFLDQTASELMQGNQQPELIHLIVVKAVKFLELNIDILQELIRTLKDEQMFDAVLFVARGQLQLSTQRQNKKMMAFSNMIIGEILVQEFSKQPGSLEQAKTNLFDAHEAYQKSSTIFNDEEYCRVCMSFSTLFRLIDNPGESKRFLELCASKSKDNQMLLRFYLESCSQLFIQGKFNQALDSIRKAYDLGKQLYKDDDYHFFEIQFKLAETLEKTAQTEEANQLFDLCFKNMDGRLGDDNDDDRKSVKSTVSKAVSMSRRRLSVGISQRQIGQSTRQVRDMILVNKNKAQALVMQNFAINLRQKHQYTRAKRLFQKAIEVKKELNKGSEIHAEIAYMYSELAVTYHSAQNTDKAITCVKKQLNILDLLDKTQNYDYMSSLNFLGELYSEMKDSANAIETFQRTVQLQNQILKAAEKMDQVQTLKMLGEELVNDDRIEEGILCIKDALEIQVDLVGGNLNQAEVQDTMSLLAEAYSVGDEDDMISEALKIYIQLADLRASKPSQQVEVYKLMAPLYSLKQDYMSAVACQRKCLDLEQDETNKIQLLTKIAGNLKKANDVQGAVEATEQAYNISRGCFGASDITTCKCLANLAAVNLFFNMRDEAKSKYQSYLDQWQDEWENDLQHQKLRKQVEQALQNLQQDEEENEEYDEENDIKIGRLEEEQQKADGEVEQNGELAENDAKQVDSIVFTQIGDDSLFIMDNTQTYSTPRLPTKGESITFIIGGLWQQPADLVSVQIRCYGPTENLVCSQDYVDVEQVQPGGWSHKYVYDVLAAVQTETYNITLTGFAADKSELFMIGSNKFMLQ